MIKDLLSEDGRYLNRSKLHHKGPLTHGYKTELDVKYEYDSEHVSLFQQLIGIL